LTFRFLIAYLRGSEKRELKREFVRLLLDAVPKRRANPAFSPATADIAH
jgi:hypothetical protein